MIAYLPWLIFLACPLLMMFMMRGMGGMGSMGSDKTPRDQPSKSDVHEVLAPEQTQTSLTGRNGSVASQARIDQLESEVAELRAAAKRGTGESTVKQP